MPIWPADVFAIATSLLQRTGAYTAAMDHWPPDGQEATWAEDVRTAGQHWRQHWNDGTFDYLDESWALLLQRQTLPIDELSQDTDLLRAEETVPSELIEAIEAYSSLPIFDQSLQRR